ncbi:hypothetical protein VTK56DRAFT_5750 [Thermocarpiscus australiensis]
MSSTMAADARVSLVVPPPEHLEREDIIEPPVVARLEIKNFDARTIAEATGGFWAQVRCYDSERKDAGSYLTGTNRVQGQVTVKPGSDGAQMTVVDFTFRDLGFDKTTPPGHYFIHIHIQLQNVPDHVSSPDSDLGPWVVDARSIHVCEMYIR